MCSRRRCGRCPVGTACGTGRLALRTVLTSAAFVPGAPLVVPALAGPGATDVVELRTAVLSAAHRLSESAQRWIAIGVGDPGTAEARWGTFAGFGVDERVSLEPDDVRDPGAPVSETMSAPMLVAGWIRGQVAPSATVSARVIEMSATPAECAEIGAELGARIAATDTPVGLLVVADGSFGLSSRAPGGLIEGAAEISDGLDAAVAVGDLDAICSVTAEASADAGIVGRGAWQVAASAWRNAGSGVPRAESLYCAAPFGVGYQVAWWGRCA